MVTGEQVKIKEEVEKLQSTVSRTGYKPQGALFSYSLRVRLTVREYDWENGIDQNRMYCSGFKGQEGAFSIIGSSSASTLKVCFVTP